MQSAQPPAASPAAGFAALPRTNTCPARVSEPDAISIDGLGVAKFVAECDALAQKYGERFKPNALLRKVCVY